MSDTPQAKYTEQYILNNVYDETLKSLSMSGVSGTILRIEYDGNSNPIYIGLSGPGIATSAPKWQIRKLTFDGNNNVTSILYANSSPLFDQVWDDRASLTYA